MYYILLDSLAKRDCGEYFSAVCNGQCSIFKRGRNCKNVFYKVWLSSAPIGLF